MVRRERREPSEARQRAMRKLAEREGRTQATVDKILVRPEYRGRVEELMRDRWREPVIVLRLDENTALGFDVPGRRLDGTVTGRRLVRRLFWNIARGVGGAVLNVFSLFNGGGMGNPFRREIRVAGPANAMALELLDELRPARGPWLVCSPSHLAVVDTGSTYVDPADAPSSKIIWQAANPHGARISFRKRMITWPDGSTFTFPLHGDTEVRHLRNHHEFPDVIHWHGRPDGT